jgi:hypothetical protein
VQRRKRRRTTGDGPSSCAKKTRLKTTRPEPINAATSTTPRLPEPTPRPRLQLTTKHLVSLPLIQISSTSLSSRWRCRGPKVCDRVVHELRGVPRVRQRSEGGRQGTLVVVGDDLVHQPSYDGSVGDRIDPAPTHELPDLELHRIQSRHRLNPRESAPVLLRRLWTISTRPLDRAAAARSQREQHLPARRQQRGRAREERRCQVGVGARPVVIAVGEKRAV